MQKLYVHLLLVIEYLIVRGHKQILKAKSEQVSQKYLFAVHYSDGDVGLFAITGLFLFLVRSFLLHPFLIDDF